MFFFLNLKLYPHPTLKAMMEVQHCLVLGGGRSMLIAQVSGYLRYATVKTKFEVHCR